MNRGISTIDARTSCFGAWFIVVASCWSILIAVLAWWDYREGCSAALAIAQSTAGDSIDRDLLYREWADIHGRRCVPSPAGPNPGSETGHVPDENVAKPTDEAQASLNSAFARRRFNAFWKQQAGGLPHITSLKPSAAESEPDEWEKSALLALEEGKKEVSSLELVGDEYYFRLMRPLVMDSGCLKCHAAQGDREGALRGGLSISLPWASSQNAVNAHIPMLLLAYGGMWGIGVLALRIFFTHLRRHLTELKQSESALQESQARLAATLHSIRESEERHREFFVQSKDALMTLAGPSWRFTAGNPAALALYGAKSLDEFLSLGPWDLSPERQPDGRTSAEKAKEMIDTALNRGSHSFEWTHRRMNGEVIPCTVLLTRMSAAGQVFLQATVRDVSELKMAEMALRESEAKYRLILDHSSDLIWNLSPEGIFIYVSPSWARVTGYDPCTIVGSSFHPLVHPDDLSICLSQVSKAIATKEAVHIRQFRVRYADGSWHWHLASGTPALGPSGEVIAIIGVSHDITERKQAEEQLRASEARLHAITDSAQDAILMMDPEGLISFWNRAAESILGYTSEEALGNNLHNLLVPERYLGSCLAAMPDFFRTGRGNAVGKTLELAARRKDGQEIAVAVSLSSVLLNGEWHAVGILRDITDSKQAEEELRESKQQLELAMEGAQMGEWHWDVVEDTRYFSDRTCSLLGITPSKPRVSSEGFFAAMPPKDRQTVRAALRRTLDDDQPYEAEYHVTWPDGSTHCIATRGMLSRDHAGRPLRINGIVWDVTARRQVEDELKFTVAALESANKAMEEFNRIAESATRAKSEFLANMSHEIRTPMTAILGYAEVLLGEPGIDRAPPERIETIRTIQRNGQHLLELINDILDLSKIEAGKLDIERIACSPVQVLADVIALMRVRADAKGLSLTLEHVGGIPESIHSDPLRLRQVLINLIGNAIKFTETGRVRVVARLVQQVDKPASMQFDVIDTGIGLSQQQISKLFMPFSQGDSSTTRRFGGTGLGLTISKRLAEMLGGDIAINSVPGKGSTFSATVETGDLDGVALVDIPIPSLPERSEAAAAAMQLDCRILLAEDGLDNQRLIALLLRKAGAEVTLVENGHLAVEKALAASEQGRPFDVILMDMQMPVMDGYTATRELRERKYAGPIIALTAHAMAEDRQKCLEAGCDDFATKPIDRHRLLAMAAHWAAFARAGNVSPAAAACAGTRGAPVAASSIYSRLAADPDLSELVDMFVQEMPDRMDALEAEARSCNWSQLARIAHQLKGAAGSYGFEAITPYAASLEAAARSDHPDEATRSPLTELLSQCRRMRSGMPPAEGTYCPNTQIDLQ